MKDLNAVIKNLDKINKVGWFAEVFTVNEWLLTSYNKNNEMTYIKLSNDNFLDDLREGIDSFDQDDYVRDALAVNPKARFTSLLQDAEDYYNKMCALYNELKSIDDFSDAELTKYEDATDEDEEDDSREESKESD